LFRRATPQNPALGCEVLDGELGGTEGKGLGFGEVRTTDGERKGGHGRGSGDSSAIISEPYC